MTQALAQRALQHLNDTHLCFSCYRIRRNWSLPLPLKSLPDLDVQVRRFSGEYPWQIWCLWALEERLYSLSGAASFLNDQAALDCCIEELEALAHWPRYTVDNKLDLPYGHAVQLMAMALSDWDWLPVATQQSLQLALQRAVEEGLLLIPPGVQALTTTEELLAKPSPHQHLHNIPLIAQAAMASAAEVIYHPERELLSSRFLKLYQARLELYHQGLTEGISYDGYLYNFALGWLGTQHSVVVKSIVDHPAMKDLEYQARGLACPGNIVLTAEVGDVEPLEMPFVWSALARLQQWSFSPTREALLDAVPPERLRADALWLQSRQAKQNDQAHNVSPERIGRAVDLPAVQQCTSAVTLASGLSVDDLSVVISLCHSPMNHIQADSGTLLIGHAERWWITDPGYQQYIKTSERDFTLGPEAHNTPVINSYGQAHKAGKLLYSGECAPSLEVGGAYAVIDLTACYPIEARVETVTRTIWRLNNDQVVVCDTVVATPDSSVVYHWHGDAEVYWGELAGAVSLYHPLCLRTLWIQSGQQPLSLAQQHRLRGSRGQCTLQVAQPINTTHHWWRFSFSKTPDEFQAADSHAYVGATKLALEDLLPKSLPSPSLNVSVQRDQLQVAICRGDELLANLGEGDWQTDLSINGNTKYTLESSNRRWSLPIPDITLEDMVTLRAKRATKRDATIEEVVYTLSSNELAAIYSVPLRVYAKAQDNQVVGKCKLMSDIIEGEAEYAFYLLVDGQKSQVRWYETSSEHTFTLKPEEYRKQVQIRGFVRAVEPPNKKLSAVSLPIHTHLISEPISAMSETYNDNAPALLSDELKALEKSLMQVSKENASKFTRDLIVVQNRLYAQLESLSWLQRRLSIKGQLPPLRGWATSPDVLLRLHTHIMQTKPSVIVEFGSGASTLVIADALSQNGCGKLYSVEHSHFYGTQTMATLEAERLQRFVEIRIGALELWDKDHLNPKDAEKPSQWYPLALLDNISDIDLLWVDGPPGATCLYSRYPALPALSDKLLPHAEVWMDDTIRQEEKDICERWAKDHDFGLEYFPLEKGLGRLMRPGFQKSVKPSVKHVFEDGDDHPEQSIGLDFTLPKKMN